MAGRGRPKKKSLESISLPHYIESASFKTIIDSLRGDVPLIFILVDKQGGVVDVAVKRTAISLPSGEAAETTPPASMIETVPQHEGDGTVRESTPEKEIPGIPEESQPEPPKNEQNGLKEADKPELATELPPEPPKSSTGAHDRELKVFDRVEFNHQERILKGIVTKIDEDTDSVDIKLPIGRTVRISTGDLVSIII